MKTNCTHKQPNAGSCFVCGRDNPVGLRMQFYDDGKDTVCSDFTPDQRYQGYPEIVHGGILASILDEVVGRVAMIGDHHRFMMTVNLKVQYRLPVVVDTPLHAVGKVIRIKGRIGKAEGKIFLPDGSVACEAELTLADMPAAIATQSRIEALGWQVDPD
ncbi:MAG: PaaI family thioesterase [Gammaproteobacteria bacterium]|nr:PaaI family thioesterase [Gammaproteobacteria bacterium]